ncbi:hypothetical protein M9H77_24080 [Catharanthus roseus]|uniref:Uncharacterized protein n=1 Tax=Catharanthus roseus TaxID=4058 RepID=A0ACC0AXN8_CATRO|nr:hypothetical protein M9H77_24080 [Catharanthus roseus]
MISRSGIYYPSLVKEFYTNITQKKNKHLININTTVKEVNITLVRTLLGHNVSTPNTGPTITFGSTSRIIFANEAWEFSVVCLRVGIHSRPIIGHSRTIRNANNLSPRMQGIASLIGTNLIPRSHKGLN